MALALATSQSMPVDVANHWHGQVVQHAHTLRTCGAVGKRITHMATTVTHRNDMATVAMTWQPHGTHMAPIAMSWQQQQSAMAMTVMHGNDVARTMAMTVTHGNDTATQW